MGWRSILSSTYQTLFSLFVSPNATLSPVWKDVLKERDILKASFNFQIGNGSTTRLWLDPWLHGSKLSDRYPNLFAATTSPNNTIWESKDINENRTVVDLNINFINLVPLDFIISLVDDINSLYKLMNFHGISDPSADFVWHKSCPEGIFVMNWLASNRRLPTKDHLVARGTQVDPRCPLCNIEDQTLNHILFECHFMKEG